MYLCTALQILLVAHLQFFHEKVDGIIHKLDVFLLRDLKFGEMLLSCIAAEAAVTPLKAG